MFILLSCFNALVYNIVVVNEMFILCIKMKKIVTEQNVNLDLRPRVGVYSNENWGLGIKSPVP